METSIDLNPSHFEVVDYTMIYDRIMQFDKNKSLFIHKWYPFVEGYSKEFISSILNELDYKPTKAFDPFAGSGTTPVELQYQGILCYSCEVSPFMHNLASVKLENQYRSKEFLTNYERLQKFLDASLLPIRRYLDPPKAKTFEPKDGLKKWIFDRKVMSGILDIKYGIREFVEAPYQDLFLIALASILLEVSNAYRDGKSLKYRKNWQERNIKRRDVHDKFLLTLMERIFPDIENIQNFDHLVNNKTHCLKGDVRKRIKDLPDCFLDLVITSPPYLNSRDYTDIYIAELWILDLVKNYDDLRELRKSTLRSHVQVKHGKVNAIESSVLDDALTALELNMKDHWNSELLGMIKGYFEDFDILMCELRKKMIPGKKMFFNVANSAYYGVEVEVDLILAEIAENNGFEVEEIRIARYLKPSSQQKDLIDSLRETVIVLKS